MDRLPANYVPVFDEVTRYEDYEKDVRAWSLVTSYEIEKRAIILILAMPTKKKEILDHFDIDLELNVPEGVDNLLDYLEENYGADDLEQTLEIYEDFRNYQRSPDQSITEYCAGFEHRRKRIESKGIKFPNEILAFDLLRNAKITKNERKLVLTGLDYDDKDNLYKDTSQSLRKFLNDGFSNMHNQDDLRFENTYFTYNRYQRGNFRRSMRSRSVRGQFRGSRGQRGRRGGQLGNEFRNEERTGQFNDNLNPIKDGVRMRCFRCGSYRHLRFRCPHRGNDIFLTNETQALNNESENKNEENNIYFCAQHIVLYSGYDEFRNAELNAEIGGSAILDSACINNVAGNFWLNDYIKYHLNHEQKSKVITKPGTRSYRFGDNPTMKSMKEVIIPISIDNSEIMINVDIVDSNIPFLLGKSEMKRLGMSLDLANDTLNYKGKIIKLNETNSGHYYLPLTKFTEQINVFAVNLQRLKGFDLLKALNKLHYQFGHPVKGKLMKLLVDAKVWESNFDSCLDKIEENCQICKVHKRTPRKPVVAMPMSHDFNDAVCVDLKQWTGKGWILHIIDMHTRYTRSVFVDRKVSSGIIDKIMKEWVAIFGVPKMLMSDNGGEFTSDEWREVTSFLNIKKITTAAEAPWQNGLCERVHQVTDQILLKLQDSYPNLELDLLLAWSNMARNSLQMYLGFSSHQLVFGTNPNLPNILNDNLPAMNESTSCDVFAKHLNVLRASREAFIKSDSCNRIKRALRNKITNIERHYNNGQWVYYKRNDSEKWLGPAKVMFQDKKVVFIRHGSMFYKVSINRLSPVENNFTYIDNRKDKEKNDKESDTVSNDSSENNFDLIENKEVEKKNDKESDTVSDDSSENNLDLKEVKENHKSGSISKQRSESESEPEDYDCGICDKEVEENDKAIDCDICKKWCHIKCINMSEETYDSLPEEKFDWVCIRCKEKSTVNNVFVNYVPKTKLNDEACIKAKQEELNKLIEYGVYTVVDDNKQDTISTKWIITYKGEGIKARLVARGFEEEALVQKDSPTISKSGINILLILAGMKSWMIKTTDIRSAFLQGKLLEREVYIKPPKEAGVNNGKIWKLNKCLYGLSDASRQFYMSVKDVLLNCNCTNSIGDASFFYYKTNNGLEGVVVSHIDDFLHAGNEKFETEVIKVLVDKFCAGKVEEKTFSYVGIQLKQGEKGIYMNQKYYTDNIVVKKLSNRNIKQRSLDDSEMTSYRSMIGSLNWVVRGTRPDLGFHLINLSTKFQNAKVEDFHNAAKIIRKIKLENTDIFFPFLDGEAEIKLVVFSDAAYHNLDDKISSVMSYIIFCVQGEKCCPLAWKTNKVKRVVTSSLAAETLALQYAISDTIFLQNFFYETLDIKLKIYALVDNKGLAENVYASTAVDELRLNLDLACIKEDIRKGNLELVKWISGSEMLADPMTKRRSILGCVLLDVLKTGTLKLKL